MGNSEVQMESVTIDGQEIKTEVAEGHEPADDGRAVLLLSSGLDSTATFALAVEEYDEVFPMFFVYGNLARDVERRCSENLVEWAQENTDALVHDLEVVDLFTTIEGLIHSDKTASGRDSDEYDHTLGYVPFRNVMFLSIAGAFATNNGYRDILFGISKEDMTHDPPIATPYAREFDMFIEEINDVFSMASLKGDVRVRAPLIEYNLEYHQEVDMLADMGWPLQYSYSCFEISDPDDPSPCGECDSCVSRREAFEKVGVEDPNL